jgi:hypothetical protein
MKFTKTNQKVVDAIYPRVKAGKASETEITKLSKAMTREVMRRLKQR